MRLHIGLVIAATFASACANVTGVPTDFAKACSPDNEGKYIEVSGVLEQRGSIFCSSTSGRMECGFDLLESAGSDKNVRVDIEQGSGANTVDKVDRGYNKEDVKIRDSSGAQIALGSDRVRVTGKMNVVPPAGDAVGVCFMQVERIEL